MSEPEDIHPSLGEISEDGESRWDGRQWQPEAGAGPSGEAGPATAEGHLSADGRWLWDGRHWRATGS